MAKTKKKGYEKLPFVIRGELRMACALKAYSHLKQGKGKTIMQQYDSMFAYYHGKPPNRPSQIKLLAEGSTGQYRELYESVQIAATSKKADIGSTTELILKQTLHRDTLRTFRAGKEINYLDLKKRLSVVIYSLPDAPYLLWRRKERNIFVKQIVTRNKNGT